MNLQDHIASDRREEWATLNALGTCIRARCLPGSNDLEISEKAHFVGHPDRWRSVNKIALAFFNDPNWSIE